MIAFFLKKELLAHFFNIRFFIFSLLCVFLIPSSIYVQIQDYNARINEYNNLVRLDKDNQERANPIIYGPLDSKYKGFRKPASLSIFVRGFEDILPKYVIATENGLKYGSPAISNKSISLFFNKVDYLFIINMIFSLIVFLFAFDSVSGEKETGTLKLVMSKSVPRYCFIVSKFLGGFIAIIIPFLFSFLIGIVILAVQGVFIFTYEDLARIMLVLATTFLFLSAFYLLGIFISTLFFRSKSSLTILLFIWIILVLGLPAMSKVIAEIVYPIKTDQVVALEKSLVRHTIEKEKGEALSNVFLKVFPDGKFINERRSEYNKLREPIAKEFDIKLRIELVNIDSSHTQKSEFQRALAIYLSRISPSAVLRYCITNLCNTGDSDRRAFFEAADKFQEELKESVFDATWLDNLIVGEGRYSFGGRNKEKVKEEDLPRFTFQKLSLTQSLSTSWIDLLLLVLFNIVFFISSYLSFLKYDVR